LSEALQLDLVIMPGGAGVNTLMEDQEVLEFVRKQAMGARIMMSVCTGALVYGAAGLLKGRKATTHWASHHLLKHFGADPVDARVVVDGSLVTTAGVTAGYDGALRVVEILRGTQEAQSIQLYLQYAPEPPFECGSPETAPTEVIKANREMMAPLLRERLAIVERAAKRLAVLN
jgi:cyclohexyl-isocyanide hydratase